MSSFFLKLIGIITMFCDHYSDVIIGENTYLNLIGRVAFPIFAFQIAQGYNHTSNIKKYILRLSIFAVISQFSFFVYKKDILYKKVIFKAANSISTRKRPSILSLLKKAPSQLIKKR